MSVTIPSGQSDHESLREKYQLERDKRFRTDGADPRYRTPEG
jgi:hypothetical protein